MVDTSACKLTKFARLMSFANPCEISVSIMGFRVPSAKIRVREEDSSDPWCHSLCETATSFVNIEMTGEMEPRRPGVAKV